MWWGTNVPPHHTHPSERGTGTPGSGVSWVSFRRLQGGMLETDSASAKRCHLRGVSQFESDELTERVPEFNAEGITENNCDQPIE